MITNEEVFDALQECINGKWEALCDEGAYLPDGEVISQPSCELCRVFDQMDNPRACEACPLGIYQREVLGLIPKSSITRNCQCCVKGSPYKKWDYRAYVKPVSISSSIGLARKMQKTLIDVREHFFPGVATKGWPK